MSCDLMHFRNSYPLIQQIFIQPQLYMSGSFRGRIYSSEHNRRISAFWDFYFSVCEGTNNKIKKYDVLLNMAGRKGFPKQMLEQSPKEGKRTIYLETEYSRQRKQQTQSP